MPPLTIEALILQLEKTYKIKTAINLSFWALIYISLLLITWNFTQLIFGSNLPTGHIISNLIKFNYLYSPIPQQRVTQIDILFFLISVGLLFLSKRFISDKPKTNILIFILIFIISLITVLLGILFLLHYISPIVPYT